MSEEPPFLLDGARVLEYASIERTPSSPQHASAVAGGTPVDLDTVSRVAIAQNLIDDACFVLLCNDRWETFAAEQHADAASARAACAVTFRGVSLKWAPFRELSSAEQAEIETTRAFLKEMVSDTFFREK